MKFICAVHDKAAECFGNPFFVPATGLAIRQFTDEVNREHENNPIFHHPLEFSLYCLGEYDEVTGAVVSDVRKLVDAVAVRTKSD